ncbi:hypothetical protein N4P33_04675 [Streptomyces sp. 15-116A]|uniref:anti-sigma factor family protein n=1 Tax=Streptomyces sp. 15-116A TaxID=2259035 RepID=UPI0021B22DA9|nr:hypothetical protein [Streptomyces sp. 15-116A]MCT7351466.1 hypothetical protein [Streptomyces sp. 15-116A]
MTSTTDRAEHPDVAEISDLTEGLLPPERTADVRRHLDTCELCADVRASLEEIRGLLGTMPGPPRMPDEIAGRIDAALAAEALLDARAPETQSEESPEPAVAARSASTDDSPAPVSRETERVSRETSLPMDRPTGRARAATTGPGRKGRLRGRRRVAVLGTVFTVAALGLGSMVLSSMNGGSGPEKGPEITAADTFSEGKLEKQVSDLLAQSQGKSGGSRTPFGLESEAGAASPRVLKEPTVPPCVREGIGRNDAALATEEGIYQGKEALLVVLSDPSDDTRVTAYVVEATCVGNPSSADKAKVLLKHSYTRS